MWYVRGVVTSTVNGVVVGLLALSAQSVTRPLNLRTGSLLELNLHVLKWKEGC